jgi:hypothetical protein
MNKLNTMIIAASLLTAPFSAYAVDVDLDDMYHYENFSAYEVVQSTSSDKDINVTLNDMYRYDDFSAYSIEAGHQNDNETAGASVFSSTKESIQSTVLYHTY